MADQVGPAMPDRFNGCNFIDFAEGTPSPGFAPDATRVMRRIKIAWADVHENFPRAILGFARVVTDAATGKKYISRQLPHAYPKMLNTAGDRYLYCTSIPRISGIAPQGADPDLVQSYTLAEAECNYQTLSYVVLSDAQISGSGAWAGIPDEGAFGTEPAKRRYVTRLFKPASKVITLPIGAMRVVLPAGKSTILQQGLPVKIAEASVTYVHHLVPEAGVPVALIETSLGCLNHATFDGFSAQTLLFETVDIKPIVSPLGDRLADAQFTFKWLPNCSKVEAVDSADATPLGTPRGHNWILFRTTDRPLLDYYLATSDGAANGVPSYRTSDFADLFRPPQ